MKTYFRNLFSKADTEPPPAGLSLNEKQNLPELSAMVMDAMVNRKKNIEKAKDEMARVIACAAHDLLSPLTGIQLNLGLLMDDETVNSQKREWINTAQQCSDIVERICIHAIEGFRGALDKRGSFSMDEKEKTENGIINIAHFIKHIDQVVGTFPKAVPLFIEVDNDVPPEIISDYLKLFRSIMNYVTNACRHTKTGHIRLRIYVRRAGANAKEIELDMLPGALVAPMKDVLVVEVEDTGPGIELDKYTALFIPFCGNVDSKGQTKNMRANSGLGLFSVATEIGCLGGEYGVFPRQDLIAINPDVDADSSDDPAVPGSVFWFSVPLILPTAQQDVTEMKAAVSSLHEVNNKFEPTTTDVGANSSQEDSTSMSHPLQKSVKRCHFNYPETSDFDVAMGNEEPDLTPEGPSSITKLMSDDSVSDKMAERQKRVLVIDDSLTIRKALAKGFSRLGFDVDEAGNGLQGLKKLKESPYEICLLDFLMPVMDGLDVVKKYRAWERKYRPWFHQYIVGISAHANGKDAELGLKSGMDRFMGKPVPLKSLKDLSQSKPVIDAATLLDMKYKEAFDAFSGTDKSPDGKSEEEKSVVSNSSYNSSVQLSEGSLRLSCLIAENNSEKTAHGLQCLAAINGFQAVVVNNGHDALRLLKIHNWGTVFINNTLAGLPGSTCIHRFRSWEKRSRVVRQRNIFLISSSYEPLAIAPSGFDGIVGNPLIPAQITNIFESVSKESFKCNHEILLR